MEDKRRRNLIITLALAVVALLISITVWGAYNYLVGGPAIYSGATAAGAPEAYLSTTSNWYWWTVMTDYQTNDSQTQVLHWYNAKPCAAGFGMPIRCNLDKFSVFSLEFTRFVYIEPGFNNTTLVRLVTMVSIRI